MPSARIQFALRKISSTQQMDMARVQQVVEDVNNHYVGLRIPNAKFSICSDGHVLSLDVEALELSQITQLNAELCRRFDALGLRK